MTTATTLTKAELRAEIAAFKRDLLWRIMLLFGAQTALFAAIMAAVR